MQGERIRIGTQLCVNESKLNPTFGFDVIFGGNYEFVHISDIGPWTQVNGTWKGMLAHILNDMQANGLNKPNLPKLTFDVSAIAVKHQIIRTETGCALDPFHC